MSEGINKKQILLSVVMLLMMAFSLEIFVFNIRFFQTALYDPVPFSDANSMSIENGHLDADGNIELDEDAEELIITVEDINLPLKNVMLDVGTAFEDWSVRYEDHVCDVSVFVWDDSLHEVMGKDGNTILENDLYRSASKKVIHNIPLSQYIWLETYGDVRSVEFRISSASGMGRVFRINNIIFNANAPFEFSVFRFVFILVILTVLHFVFFQKGAWSADCVTPAKWKSVVPVVLLILVAVPAYVWPSLNPYVSQPLQNEYGPLARALVNGETAVGEVSDIVKESEGLMVFWNSYSNDVKFDYSSYEGKYYVYFGVLPCIVFFVPYYLATGRDLANYIPFVTLCLILIAEIYLFLGMLIRRFYRRTPYTARLLMTGAACSGMYLPLFISVPDHYTIAICFGMVLLLAGCMSWLRVVYPEDMYKGSEGIGADKKKTGTIFLALGAVCMAAVSLCRPTLLIPGFVLLALMMIRAIKARQNESANKKYEIAGCILAIAIPYMVFGLLCMFYNQLRFDSPFDFGVSKNMTAIPLNGNGGYLPFQFARSVYEYFFAPAVFTPEFPYFTYQTWSQIMEGSSILAVTKPDIGLFSGAPVLWSGLLCVLYRKKLKEKGLWNILLSMLVCAFLLMLFSTRFTSCITDRYTLEFSFIFFVCAFVGVMELYEDMREKSGERLFKAVFVIIKLIFVITLFFGVLQIIPGKGLYNLSCGDTELYYRIYYAMNFML